MKPKNVTKNRRKYDAEFKISVVLEVMKNEKTLRQLSKEFGVHPNLISRWNGQLNQGLREIFLKENNNNHRNKDSSQEQFRQQIEQLQIELDWLRKNLKFSNGEKIMNIEPDHPKLSIRRQCELLALCRASYYNKMGKR